MLLYNHTMKGYTMHYDSAIEAHRLIAEHFDLLENYFEHDTIEDTATIILKNNYHITQNELYECSYIQYATESYRYHDDYSVYERFRIIAKMIDIYKFNVSHADFIAVLNILLEYVCCDVLYKTSSNSIMNCNEHDYYHAMTYHKGTYVIDFHYHDMQYQITTSQAKTALIRFIEEIRTF